MSVENALEILECNIDESDFTGPVAKDKIKSAEEILGVEFPKSYSLFLENYGAGDIAGIEFFGIIKDPLSDSEMIPNAIWLTLSLREEIDLPKHFVVVAETGYGPYYVIDTSVSDENESPICIWDVGNQKERLFPSFGDLVVSLLQELI